MQEGAVSQPGGGGGIKNGTMKSVFSGSSLYGSTSRVRGWHFHEWYSSSGKGTILPRTVVERRLRDEECELVDCPLSWKLGVKWMELS